MNSYRTLLTSLGCAGVVGLQSMHAPMLAAEEKSEKQQRPNIVFFLIDDMGPFDTSVEFFSKKLPQNSYFKTPNMQRLAKQGVTFTRAYACPVCSPSRVSIMTGMNAARHRVTTWTFLWNKSTDDAPGQSKLKLPQWNYNGIAVQPDVPNSIYCPEPLPKRMRDAGYQTLHIGKGHFGSTKVPAPYQTAEDPIRLGFDKNIGGWAGGSPQTYYPPYMKGWGRQHGLPGLEKYNQPTGRAGTHLTKALSIEAEHLIDSALEKDAPFFLYYSHYAVHTPFEMDDRFAGEFKDDTGHPQSTKAYASLVRGMDQSLGELLDHLEKRKIMDNTVIIFMADNGGYALGDRRSGNAPLSAGKGSAHEGGVRVPLIVSMPKGLKNKKDASPVIIEDVFPTLLDIAGVDISKLPENQSDGCSWLRPIPKKRPLVFHFPHHWAGFGTKNLANATLGYGAYSSVIMDDWKYVFYHDPQRMPREELFNLKKDISETTNLVSKNKSELKKYRKTLADYLRKVDAQLPFDTVSQKQVPYPDQL